VVSEWSKPRPAIGVVEWLAAIDEDRVFLEDALLRRLGVTILTIIVTPTKRRTSMGAHPEGWSVAEAKARFSELIDQAVSDGPQRITRRGRDVVVVVAAEEWERKARRKGNLAEFFAESPLRGSGVIVERPSDRPRKPDL
jgi:prevent-host-death family protein